MATKTTKTTTPIYLRITEKREGEYLHIEARVITQKYENCAYVPYGVDDDYSDGPLYSGLRLRCQGDERSRLRGADREPVYGFSCGYADLWTVELRQARRMVKTLEKVDKGLARLYEQRGMVRSFGEYCGRVAEVLGCSGMGHDRSTAARNGSQWEWTNVGDGINRINQRVYLWQQEAQPQQSSEAAS